MGKNDYIKDPKTGQMKGRYPDPNIPIPASQHDATLPQQEGNTPPVLSSTDYAKLFTTARTLLESEIPSQENIAIYEVGGCVRDSLVGQESKDIDFSVEAPSFDALRDFLKENKFEIFLETPEFLTIRARFPKEITHPAIPTRFLGEKQLPTADFVLARKEGNYSDGRHPDEVIMGSIYDDLARRDFTVNAIARDKCGKYLDPHGGQADLQAGILRAVGNAEERLREDALRALRAIRFSITKNLTPDEELWTALRSTWLPPLLASVSYERRREELHKAFKKDTVGTMNLLYEMNEDFRNAVFEGGLWLKPTMEQ